MYRAIEAALWGQHEEVLITEGIEIRRAKGAYGTLYDVQLGNLWSVLRLHQWLPTVTEHVPMSAAWRVYEGDDEEECVFMIHFWEDANVRQHTPIR